MSTSKQMLLILTCYRFTFTTMPVCVILMIEDTNFQSGLKSLSVSCFTKPIILQQQVIADVLPPTPDPSQFTFNETALASVESNSATLTLKLRLIGGTLLPFTSSNQDVVVKAFQQEVNSSSGNFLRCPWLRICDCSSSHAIFLNTVNNDYTSHL